MSPTSVVGGLLHIAPLRALPRALRHRLAEVQEARLLQPFEGAAVRRQIASCHWQSRDRTARRRRPRTAPESRGRGPGRARPPCRSPAGRSRWSAGSCSSTGGRHGSSSRAKPMMLLLDDHSSYIFYIHICSVCGIAYCCSV